MSNTTTNPLSARTVCDPGFVKPELPAGLAAAQSRESCSMKEKVNSGTTGELTEQGRVAAAVGGFGRGDGRLLGVGRHRGRDFVG